MSAIASTPKLRRSTARPARRGLSTLEMCLVLPLLMSLAALLIHTGVAGVWQVRGLNVARETAWAGRYPRNATGAAPEAWPAPATQNGAAAADMALLDLPEINHAVVRGPLPGATVREALLDPTLHARSAEARTTLHPKIPPRAVALGIHHVHGLLDNTWNYLQMGMSSNTQNRIDVIYELQKADPSLVQRYVQAAVAIYYAPFQNDLAPLDREQDFPRFGQGAPDFHPRLQPFESLDVAWVHEERVKPLLDRIENVPRNMAQSYLGLYNGALQNLENQLNSDPPPSAAQAAALQSQLDALHSELDPLIEQLEDFLGGL